MLHRALREAGASEETDILELRARRQARHDIVPHVLPVVHENALQKWEFRQQLYLSNCQGFRRFPTAFDSNVLKLPARRQVIYSKARRACAAEVCVDELRAFAEVLDSAVRDASAQPEVGVLELRALRKTLRRGVSEHRAVMKAHALELWTLLS